MKGVVWSAHEVAVDFEKRTSAFSCGAGRCLFKPLALCVPRLLDDIGDASVDAPSVSAF